jgi:hypothetical protein
MSVPLRNVVDWRRLPVADADYIPELIALERVAADPQTRGSAPPDMAAHALCILEVALNLAHRFADRAGARGRSRIPARQARVLQAIEAGQGMAIK